ncbi:MAG: transposase, partial [Planctomycetota bacterium]
MTPEQIGAIECVTMDMCKAYISSTKKHVPDAEAKICFDRFHVSKLLGDALDKVRREEHRALTAEGDDSLTRTKHLLLRRGDSLREDEVSVVDILKRLGLKV